MLNYQWIHDIIHEPTSFDVIPIILLLKQASTASQRNEINGGQVIQFGHTLDGLGLVDGSAESQAKILYL